MLKKLSVIVALVAVYVLGFASETVVRAFASPAAPIETVAAVSLPSHEAALQRLKEADGTVAMPGEIEPVLVGSPQPAKQARAKPIQRR